MTQHTADSIATLVQGRVVGDATRRVSGLADLRMGGPEDIGFVRDPKYADMARASRVGVVLVREPLDGVSATQIVVPDPYVAFADTALALYPIPTAQDDVRHPTAVCDESATLESPVRLGPRAVVEAGARIGRGTVLEAGVTVMRDAVVGRDCTLFPGVVLYPGTKLGDRVVVHAGSVLGSDGFGYARDGDGAWHKLPHLGRLVLEDDVEIGANCAIDRGMLGETRLGCGTKIDNLVHIAHNCSTGRDVAVAALSALSGSTALGDRVVFGGHVVAAGHLHVTDDARIAGNSALRHDVTEPGDYAGYPLMPKSEYGRFHWLMRRALPLYEEYRKRRKAERAGESSE